ncbi:unnamed protein product [Schistosoma mattheei]|uniref:Uncharacterized protein n=1 Tax=Schistosoma mattheei TaxID=31246 RepID=A0A183NSM4_9TREM|nr:unnamed protein product [Schistosoma mattheei]
MQKRTLKENKGVEIITNRCALAAGPTDAATLSHVTHYSDLPTKSANLPIMPVVTSDNQCKANDDTNLIFSSLPLEAHNQIPSSNATALKNTVKIKKSMPRKKSVRTEPSGSRSNDKNITMALPYKTKNILPDIMLYPNHRRGVYENTFDSNVTQDGHYNHCVSRPNIRQTTVSQQINPPYQNSDLLAFRNP